MAKDNIIVLEVDTSQSVKNVAQLKENIKILKEKIEDANQDLNDPKVFEDYTKNVEKLKENQTALKNAMYATTGSFEDITKAAKGNGQTYNALVAQMAKYKSELRNIDVSTDEGKKSFAEMAEKIDDINSKLKAMDQLQGNFSRNVGNYQSAFKGLGEKVDVFDKGLKATQLSANNAKGALDALGKSPTILLMGVLVSTISNLVTKFKESEEGTKSLEAAMVTFEPIINAVKAIFTKLAEILGDLFVKASAWIGSSGLLPKIKDAVMGVGNAIVEFVIAPFKGVAAAIKVFQEEGIKGIGKAAKAFAEEAKNGITFKANYEAGVAMGDTLIDGLSSTKDKLKDSVKDAVKEGIEEATDFGLMSIEEMNKLFEQHQREWDEERRAKAKEQAELDKMVADDLAATNAEIDAYFEGLFHKDLERMKEQREAAEAMAQARIDSMYGVANATLSVMNSLADIYESEGENNKKAAKKAKAIRIATATIDTISGAVSAFASYQKQGIPQPYATILGAAQAAVVTATGMAQIAKIRSTNVDGSATASASTSSASVSAPSVDTQVAQVRNVTTASEEERLNSMASDQRVVLVMSDLETKQNQVKVQTEESSF